MKDHRDTNTCMLEVRFAQRSPAEEDGKSVIERHRVRVGRQRNSMRSQDQRGGLDDIHEGGVVICASTPRMMIGRQCGEDKRPSASGERGDQTRRWLKATDGIKSGRPSSLRSSGQ